jgi:hypothetical protein
MLKNKTGMLRFNDVIVRFRFKLRDTEKFKHRDTEAQGTTEFYFNNLCVALCLCASVFKTPDPFKTPTPET